MNQGAAYLYQDAAVLKTIPGALDATVGTHFAEQLAVVVKDASGNPLAGVPVTFSLGNGTARAGPASGAGAAFPDGQSAVTVMTNSGGEAVAPALRANDIAGSYTVTATLGNTSTTFTLTNIAGAPADVAVVGGGSQVAHVSSKYAERFQVLVTDRFGNPVPGVLVSFAVPKSGPSGTFAAGSVGSTNGLVLAGGGASPQGIAILIGATVPTNALGIATAPTFTANHRRGHFSVTATVPGVRNSAKFNLINAVRWGARRRPSRGGDHGERWQVAPQAVL
jgi:hypothetical protein